MSEAKDLIQKMCELQNSNEEIQKEMAGWSGVVQYKLDGEEFYVEYKADGTCEFKEGVHPSPTFAIVAPPDYWASVIKGQEDAVSGFMMGKYKIEGNIMEAQRLAGIVKKFQGKFDL
ncbi:MULTISPECIES: SCP2 sterol-binding domain-containing protein [unclassified Archaeoglobus]|uniref:SCP2 sterol-binding domain-containing protein n=1 Tax=unclassified Archaeoglobus TaxID=2643606 RepID=UPI0025BB47E4|nr:MULTISPECIES: SCP2 sterol-binding domain-containing protein [unclassified Archaeoglobus]